MVRMAQRFNDPQVDVFTDDSDAVGFATHVDRERQLDFPTIRVGGVCLYLSHEQARMLLSQMANAYRLSVVGWSDETARIERAELDSHVVPVSEVP